MSTNLAPGDERFADRGRQPRRERESSASSAVAARFGQPIAASTPEAAPSMGNREGAAPTSGGTTQSSSALRDRTRPLPSRASSSSGTMAIASAAPAESAIVVGLGPKRGLADLIGEAPLQPRAFGRLGGAGEPHGNFKALAGANGRARRLRDDEPRPLKFGQALRRKRAGGSEHP